jgi:hypothetical protein
LIKKDEETWLWEIEYETKIKEAYIKKQQLLEERLYQHLKAELENKLQRSSKTNKQTLIF